MPKSQKKPKSVRRPRKQEVVRISARGNLNILPPILETDLELPLSVYVAAGNVSMNAASINVSSLIAPFNNVSFPFTGSAGSTPFDGVVSQGSGISQNPVGYTFFTTIYATYKILSYDLMIQCIPQNGGDSVTHALFPTGAQESRTTGSWTWTAAAGQPYCKSGTALNGANTKTNRLHLRGTPYQCLGLTRQQWLDLPNTAIASTSAFPSYVVYYAGMPDGSTNSTTMTFIITLRLRVRFSDSLQVPS